MAKKYKTAIYLFNRDLRWQDNECLAKASAEANKVYPIFILTPEQTITNPYINHKSIHFMCASLKELAATIPICFFEGHTAEILERLIKQHKPGAIYNNVDITPYAKKRTAQIKKLCLAHKIDFVGGNDIFLGRHCALTKADGKPYLKYTPFYNNALGKVRKEAVIKSALKNLYAIGAQNKNLLDKFIDNKYSNPIFAPGRKMAEVAIKKFIKANQNYKAVRNEPHKNATTHLSAYLHFGILGPVEVMVALDGTKNYNDIVRQLLWREFYLYITWMAQDPTKKSITVLQNNNIRWKKSKDGFKKWCEGKTGCPIVDAGMRELNATGYMQNRLRMIVAMYLIFYLHLDWRMGEKYFAQNLCDYDYCNNLGGWVWCAGWEIHSNEYYRAFSMASQMKRFDPDGIYVKKWVPELLEVPAKDLYEWEFNYKKYPNVKYPVARDLKEKRKAGIEIYAREH